MIVLSIFFSICSFSIPCGSGRTISHTTLSPTGLANHINPVPLDIVICPAISINTKQINQNPSLEFVYKTEEESCTFFLLGSAELWGWASRAVGDNWECLSAEWRQAELSKVAERPARGPRGMGHGVSVPEALLPAAHLILWTSPVSFSGTWVTKLLLVLFCFCFFCLS